ncbi:ATP synthase subunit g [Verticillium dahliae VDG2]|nr:ATP synthase subunit g [Verticillium dahliae VDG2]
MSSPPWDYIAKLVCIGDSGCGKSSLTIRLCEGRFSPHHDVTIGVEFGSRIADLAATGDGGSGTDKREVSRAEAEAWARKNGVLEYVETSAKSGEGVEKAFMRVAERIFLNIQAGKYDLNDRRSGVKGQTAGGNKQIRLGDAAKTGGGCC